MSCHALTPRARDALAVQGLGDGDRAGARAEQGKDALHDRRLVRIDHPIAAHGLAASVKLPSDAVAVEQSAA